VLHTVLQRVDLTPQEILAFVPSRMKKLQP
jgi:hypothetical protein